MKERLKIFFNYGLFWLSYFFAARGLFLFYQSEKTARLSLQDILLSFLHGFRLDLSTTGYFLLIPGLLLTLSTFVKARVVKIPLLVYTVILLILCSFVIILDLEMYQHWQFRLDATPLLYIGEDTPLAIPGSTLALLILLWVIYCSVFCLFYYKKIQPLFDKITPAKWPIAAGMLLITAFMIAPIRGTIGVAPINTGVVYFHPTKIFANHAAINAVWNTGYALSKYERLKYPDNLLSKNDTQEYYNKFSSYSGPSGNLIHGSHPNILLIIMESFTFRFIEPLGGIRGIAPHFSHLAKEGILFTNMYASGDRTDKGVVSILNGYPAQPISSIIKYPKKTQELPYLNKKFKELGYFTSFTYGGNIDFANFRSYLSNAQFDQITHSDDFPQELNTSKWGVHDEYVFERFLAESNEAKTPFFKVMLTLSSHEPFDVPMKTVFAGEDEQSKFFNSAHYTDRALGKFIESARQQPWWKNTIVVITADHGHMIPNNNGVTNADRFKIPMLWLGGALNVRDTTINTYASQTDIANTLLGQVSKEDKSFMFSRNIIRPHHDFAVYIYNNGYGFINDSTHFIYDNTGQRYLLKKGVKGETALMEGKAYIQKLYRDFNGR